MSHYNWIYENYTCSKCNKTNLDCNEVEYINNHDTEKNRILKPYEGKHLCSQCMKSLKENPLRELFEEWCEYIGAYTDEKTIVNKFIEYVEEKFE